MVEARHNVLNYLVSSSFILKLTYVWEEARRAGEQQLGQDSSREAEEDRRL